MIRQILNQINEAFSELDPAPKLGQFNLKKEILDLIHSDLTHLSRNDPTFFEGREGYVDFYSPYAETQIKNKQELLEKYIDKLIMIKACCICVQQKKIQLSDINGQKEKYSDKASIKKELQDLIQGDFSKLSARQDIQKQIKRIKKINAFQQQFKKIDSASPIEGNVKKQKRMQQIIKNFDEHTKYLSSHNQNIEKQLNSIEKEINNLQINLQKHTKLKNKIPHGMLDVKRALNIQQELKDVKFSTSESIDLKFKEMLEDLKNLMASSITGYRELAVLGGDIDAFLHQTTGFYWENLYLYRKTLFAINEYMSEKMNLTIEGKLVVECLKNACEKVPDESVINDALRAVKNVDRELSKRRKCYVKKAGQSEYDIKFYKTEAHGIIIHLLNNSDNPFFFVPYNSNNYALDHPEHTDLAGALGNCYGETQMFLQRINQKKPTFNNICPQLDLINYQLDQSRKAGPLDTTIGVIDTSIYGLIRLSIDPNEMDKDKLKLLLNDKPAYVLFGTVIYFVDDKLQIISEVETLSYRNNEALTQLFPKNMNKLKTTTVKDRNEIKKLIEHSANVPKVKWETIKHLLTQEADSKKHGDVCWIKLSGATNSEGTEFAHVLGFIKMKEATPYKYIVYDYGLGPMGFSTEEQLQLYFKTVLENYYSFSKCTIKKVAEVSDEGQQFINGSTGVQPLKKAEINTSTVRKYWNKQRLLLLIKYGNNEINFLLDNILLLKSNDAKKEIYHALLASDAINFAQLFSQCISFAKKGNTEPLEMILKSDNLNYSINKIGLELSPNISDLIISMMKNGTISADLACKIFSDNIPIVLAAFESDNNSLQFADVSTVLTLMDDYRNIIPIAVAIFPRNERIFLDAYNRYPLDPTILLRADKSLIIELIKQKKIQPNIALKYLNHDKDIVDAVFVTFKNIKTLQKEVILNLIGNQQLSSFQLKRCCKAFNNDQDVILAAFKIDPESLAYADTNLADKLVEQGFLPTKATVRHYPHEQTSLVTSQGSFTSVAEPFLNEAGSDSRKEGVITPSNHFGSSLLLSNEADRWREDIISKFEELLADFRLKLIQLEQKPKLIQRGFFVNTPYQETLIVGKNRLDNLEKAIKNFKEQGTFERFIKDCDGEFMNEETNKIFAINRSALWFRSISYSYEQLKMAIYYLASLLKIPCAIKLEKPETCTAKKSRAFKEGWEELKENAPNSINLPVKSS